MFLRLLLLFTIVPMVELSILINLGGYIGPLATLGLVALTGIIGVSLAREQGFVVISKIRSSLDKGKLPADSLIEGLLILIGGVMLLTPGLLTDITGFLLIIPITRNVIRDIVKSKFKVHINHRYTSFTHQDRGSNYSEVRHKEDDEWEDLSESIDVDYEEID